MAKAIFEQNGPELYKAYLKAALKGNAYAFKELADRAFGKLREVHQVEVSPYHDQSEEGLVKRIAELEKSLGYDTPRILPPADDPKPN